MLLCTKEVVWWRKLTCRCVKAELLLCDGSRAEWYRTIDYYLQPSDSEGCSNSVMEAMASTSTDLTLDIGFTGGNTDWVADGFDYDGAAVNAYTAPVVAELPIQIDAAGTNNSLDVLIATQTGTFTGGKLRIFAYVMDATNIDDEDGMPGAVARDVV